MERFLGDRYELLKEIGAGGMALVYEARDLALGRTVAVKILREEFGNDLQFVGRFEQEARSAASLTHPSIVTVYDVGEADGLQYIVMEYVDGLSLKELVREVSRLSIDRAVAVASQVCAGLAFAHENGIIHRDVKPQNILISAPGGDTAGVGPGNEIRARLTDFGIARASGASSFTKDNEVLGSVHYIAPEQVQGFETGPAADIYATGVVLYEMLTGEQPFTDDTAIGVAMKHIQQDPTPPRQLNAAIPEALEAVVLRALAKLPEDRFTTASEMQSALRAIERVGQEQTGAIVPAPRAEPAPPRPETAGVPSSAAQRQQQPAPSPAVSVPAAPFVAFDEDDVDEPGMSWAPIILAALTAFWLVGGILMVVGGVLEQAPAAALAPENPSAPSGKQADAGGAAKSASTDVEAPNLIGMASEQARGAAEERNLTYRVETEEFSAEIEENAVISQRPEPGSALDPGDEIVVTISLGKELLLVPPLTGLNYEDAAERAVGDGFTVARDDAFDDKVAIGLVIEQDPPVNDRIEPGETITLLVSRGSEGLVVPDLVGKRQSDAEELIRDAKLRVGPINLQGRQQLPQSVLDQVCVGCVLSQIPSPGRSVDPGATVLLAVREE